MALGSHKKYSEGIPSFPRNMPKPFVDHCLKRLGQENVEWVRSTDEGFSIRSKDSSNIYLVCISQSVKCSCPDWKKFHWPCKYILHIILTQSGLGWESLPQSYRSSSLFN